MIGLILWKLVCKYRLILLTHILLYFNILCLNTSHIVHFISILYTLNRTAIPCPKGYAQGTCPTGMYCIADAPCSDEKYIDWLEQKQEAESSSQEFLVSNPLISVIPSNSQEEASNHKVDSVMSKMKQPSSSSSSTSSSAIENPPGNQYFCGNTFEEADCSRPCPTGVSADYCDEKHGCFFVPSRCVGKFLFLASQ